jgi:hypothetical protein
VPIGRTVASRPYIVLWGRAFGLHHWGAHRAVGSHPCIAPLGRALVLPYRVEPLHRAVGSRPRAALGPRHCIVLLDRRFVALLGCALVSPSCCWIAPLRRTIGLCPCIVLLGRCALASCYWVAAPLRPAIGPCALLGHTFGSHPCVATLGWPLHCTIGSCPCIVLLGPARVLRYWVAPTLLLLVIWRWVLCHPPSFLPHPWLCRVLDWFGFHGHSCPCCRMPPS